MIQRVFCHFNIYLTCLVRDVMVQKPDVIEKKKNLEKDSNLSKNIEFHGSETFEQ